MKKSKYLLLSALALLGFSAMSPQSVEAVYFRSCSEAWRMGYGDIMSWQDGYRRALDRD